MKYFSHLSLILSVFFLASCSALPRKQVLTDIAEQACSVARLSNLDYHGQSVDYWCTLGSDIDKVFEKLRQLEQDGSQNTESAPAIPLVGKTDR